MYSEKNYSIRMFSNKRKKLTFIVFFPLGFFEKRAVTVKKEKLKIETMDVLIRYIHN